MTGPVQDGQFTFGCNAWDLYVYDTMDAGYSCQAIPCQEGHIVYSQDSDHAFKSSAIADCIACIVAAELGEE